MPGVPFWDPHHVKGYSCFFCCFRGRLFLETHFRIAGEFGHFRVDLWMRFALLELSA